MSDRSGSPHRPPYDHTLHPGHTQLLPWFSKTKDWTMDLISVVVVHGWWYLNGHAIPPFHECHMRHGPHLTGVDYLLDHRMTSKYTQTCSYVTLGFGIVKSLNNGSHQWCRVLRTMTQVWICYPTVPWVLYESWTTFDRGGSPPRSYHDLQRHPKYAHFYPGFRNSKELEQWTSSVV